MTIISSGLILTFNANTPQRYDAITKKVTITRTACLIDYNDFYYLIKLKLYVFFDDDKSERFFFVWLMCMFTLFLVEQREREKH